MTKPYTPTELRAAREALGLTQTGFAEIGAPFGLKVASDRRTVRYWEAGERAIPGAVWLLVLLLISSAGMRKLVGIAEAGVDLTKLAPETRRRMGL